MVIKDGSSNVVPRRTGRRDVRMGGGEGVGFRFTRKMSLLDYWEFYRNG